MTAAPRVSVVMTIHNAAPFLRAAVDSVLEQSFGDFELVAIENGSSDGSDAILAAYDDPRIRVFPHAANIGRTPALNDALRRARGALIAVLDADDIALPDRLARQTAYFDRRPETALLGGRHCALYVDGTLGPPTGEPFDDVGLLEALAVGNPFCHSATMFPRAAAAAVGGYDETRIYGQDYALWIALSQRGPLAMLPGDPVTYLRLHPASATNSPEYRLPRLRDMVDLLRLAGADPRLSPAGRRASRRAAAAAALRCAEALAATGRRGAAALEIARALRDAPADALEPAALAALKALFRPG